MARYIDADALIAEYDRVHIGAPGGARKLMVEAPTADVEPRAEVAREIFWEMDKLLLSITIDEEAEESFVGFDFDKYIALKKKYTQPEPPKGN